MKKSVNHGKKEKTDIATLENNKGIANHKTAAKHHEAAAQCHHDAAKHHQAGNHEKAACCTVVAHGHNSLANKAQKEDVKHHALMDK